MNLTKNYIKYNKRLRPPTEKDMRIQAMLKNPLMHFVLFGMVMIIFMVLCEAGILKSSYVVTVGRTMIYSMAALGFCLLLGYSGLASLATAGFMGMGAYLTGSFLTDMGLPITVSLVLTALVLIVVGCIIGFISLRIKGMFLAIITLGIGEILASVFIAMDGWTGGQSGMIIGYPYILGELIGLGLRLDRPSTYVILTVSLSALMAATTNLINSPTGRAMLAMKNSTSAAQAFGIGLLKYRLLAFIISTLYCAVAGFMYMIFIRASFPDTWNLGLSLSILAAIIIGGMKSVWGAVGGSFILFGLNGLILQNIEFFQQNSTFIELLTGALTIVIVMFFPGGLQQIFIELKNAIKKLIAKFKRWRYGDEQI